MPAIPVVTSILKTSWVNYRSFFFDRIFEDIDAVKIITNDYESAYNATQHLIDCGCKRIVYLSGLGNLLTGKKRLSGYLDALKNNCISFDKKFILDGYADEDGVRLGNRD